MIVLQILEGLGVAVMGISGVAIYFWILSRQHLHKMRKLEHEREQGDVEINKLKARAITQAITVATNNGANVRVIGKDVTAMEITYFYPPPVPHTYSPHIQYHGGTAVSEEKQEQIEGPQLPGHCDFADILAGWRPTPQSIFLALAPGGQYVTVPLKALCHVALAGATGGGKSVLMRLLLAQLLYVGANVILVDPHYAEFDPESGEDWRPISSRLYMPPAVKYPAIRDTLRWMARDELPKRLELRGQTQPPGTPFFLGIDELPAIVKHVPEAPEYMDDLLKEGRKVGLYLVTAAQDWLVKTIGSSGAVRDCFRTAFYVGGDAQSARVLLDIRGRVDDGGLGKGVVMMRSSATLQASLSRIPFASNEALYSLLPTAAATSNPTTPPLQNTFIDEVVESVPSKPPEEARDARSLHVRDLLRSGMSRGQIIQELYPGVKGGAKYTEATKEIDAIIAKLV